MRAGETRARTVFFGSGSFAVPILEALVGAPEVELVGVVAAPDRPAGRGGETRSVPVVRRARERGLSVLQPARVRAPEAIEAIARLRPDLGVLADYGQLIPEALLALPARGILNVHPSLLPRHRGAAPIQATILAGDREAGVTLIRMDAGLDSGPIVAAERWLLDGTETTPELEARAAAAGAALLRRSLAGWLAGTLSAQPQPAEGVTLTRPLRREDGRLDPARTAVELERQVRAYQPWPGSFVDSSAGRLVVWRASVRGDEAGLDRQAAGVPGRQAAGAPGRQAKGDAGQAEPGRLVVDGDELGLVTADGLLRLEEVQLAGRRRMRASELRRGHPELVGERVR